MSEDIKITGEFTPDPAVCRFMVSQPILEDWALQFSSPAESQGSPLVDELFRVPGVAAIRISGSVVTVTKNVMTPWPELAPPIGKAIRSSLGGSEPPLSEAAIDNVRLAPAADIEPLVTELFEQHINPALSSHGGYVRLVKVEDRDVHLEMGGGCQGCSASQATLRYGIESAIREVVPQVRNIVDATDHDAGANPYYT